MATSVLDAPLPIRPAGAAGHPRRRPLAVLLLAAVCGLQSLALLACGLTGLDGLLTAASRPAGPVVVAVLGGLAGWIVACGAAALGVLEGPGRRLAAGVACAEVVLVAGLLLLGLLTPVLDGLPVTLPLPLPLPLPALALLALAVPVGKLLLASAPSALAWAAVVRPRHEAPAAVTHPRVRLATVAVIGLALCTLAVTTPVGGELPAPATAGTGQH
ncbi:hypothetical protein JOD57_003204 [Geodermatophilus bullaregiensis]|uniref:hypothetical protein n=1 Tax=Geodermatophilus bullaregiensis TaxID=1564160 RepID=UPI0019582D80|nr:hypothetical protein [Geodermatophilus bullaregiensis]MBM7807367.1 hypothetical protein [Geodermatophilus bullaregiensis]